MPAHILCASSTLSPENSRSTSRFPRPARISTTLFRTPRTTRSSRFSAAIKSAGSTRRPERSSLYKTPTPNSAPRRGSMDSRGHVWFAEYRGNKIAMFDTETQRFQEWMPPTPWAQPYDVVADKNGEAWSGSMVNDRVTRLNPKTGEMVDYLMPRSHEYTEECLLTTQRPRSRFGWVITTAHVHHQAGTAGLENLSGIAVIVLKEIKTEVSITSAGLERVNLRGAPHLLVVRRNPKIQLGWISFHTVNSLEIKVIVCSRLAG